MFPPAAERDVDLDLPDLAREFELSGGEIKNVVLAAAYLAATEGQPISADGLRRAIRREFSKNGRVLDNRGMAGR
jgi:hypothetical protein